MMVNPWEILLARLFSDPVQVEQFLADRRAYARAANVDLENSPELLTIDAEALRFAAQSYDRKRNRREY
jgi:hypothetical protein